MSRQDRQGVRTAADLERKYDLGGQKQLLEELKKAVRKAEKDISNMQNEKPTDNTFTTTVSVFLEPERKEGDIVNAHRSGEKPLSEKELLLYDITGDGIVDVYDSLAIEKAINGDASLVNWDKAEKSEVTITIDLSSPENLIKATGTNMWGRDVEYNTGDFIQWVLKDIEANKNKIEKLKEEIKALTPEEGEGVDEEQIAEILNTIATIEQDIIDIKDDAYNLRVSIGVIAENYIYKSEFEALKNRVDAVEGASEEMSSTVANSKTTIDYLMGTSSKTGKITEIEENIDDIDDKVVANSKKNIVERGTKSSWNYEKYGDGTLRIWRKYSPSSKQFYSLANTFCYTSSNISLPSDEFGSTPTYASITAHCNDGDSMAFCSVSSLTTSSIEWETLLYNGNKDSGYFTVSYFIEVVGAGQLG